VNSRLGRVSLFYCRRRRLHSSGGGRLSSGGTQVCIGSRSLGGDGGGRRDSGVVLSSSGVFISCPRLRFRVSGDFIGRLGCVLGARAIPYHGIDARRQLARRPHPACLRCCR